jgi:6-phospho-beta-glucosidase
MSGRKIVVVGGGSTYTPELVDGIARHDEVLGASELVLLDPDLPRLAVVGGLAQRMLDHAGWRGDLTQTSDAARAFDGADIVLFQLRVGGQAARHVDETLPHVCGCIGQETTGAGGFAKALRTVPLVLELAEQVRQRANDAAWIIDFTNPVGIVTRALLQQGHRAIGLCNVAIGFERTFARWLDVRPSSIRLDHVGLNHLTWIRRVMVDDTDVLPDLLERWPAELEARTSLPIGLMHDLRAIPSYYLHYFYRHDAVLSEQLTSPSRAEAVQAIESSLLEQYRDPSLVTKPPLLDQRGGAFYSEAAVRLMASLVGDLNDVHVVNVRNDGAIAGLPDDAVVEVPATVGASGATPVALSPLAPDLAGLVHHVTAYEHLTLEAALTGDVSVARRALLAHPLIGQWGLVEELLPRLLRANAAHLPLFAGSVA